MNTKIGMIDDIRRQSSCQRIRSSKVKANRCCDAYVKVFA